MNEEKSRNDTLHRGLHFTRYALERFGIELHWLRDDGSLRIDSHGDARKLAHRLARGGATGMPPVNVEASELFALHVINQLAFFVLHRHIQSAYPRFYEDAWRFLAEALPEDRLNRVFEAFVRVYPPKKVLLNELSESEYLDAPADIIPARHLVCQAMLVNWLNRMNPAIKSLKSLVIDDETAQAPDYGRVIELMKRYASRYEAPGKNLDFISFLLEPITLRPFSLEDQLDYVQKYWRNVEGIEQVMARVLKSRDFFSEAHRPVFQGPGPSEVFRFGDGDEEPERYSPDLHWMPRLVLMAKNVFVWLHQLRKKYGRDIYRLNEIPEEELRELAEMGFTGLWLIGVWERSPASRRIKQLCGNPEATASAYSIYAYRIADELGGNEALEELKARAMRYGIRLAGDMVPNHFGIDSPWVIHHPDRFIWLSHSPFPVYSYQGPDLSPVPDVGIYIDDRYYTREDAAVVFKRIDRKTGDIRYIYHGNDGTDMPWNDTAQIDFLNPEAREAVIRTILDVAGMFPIIRFDAAMTLARKHYQRLWYPLPGSGGAIPSRADHAMTQEEFARKMPREFWREVVDRIAENAPDTLLLAEAFWLMEGYFVRTLGMHRVYNSAFMNMLRDEDNGKFHDVLKNTLAFDPEILKRFVNFMNNPDERTAVEQFGRGNKYFGVCVMMCTLPGLPMFGHGQLEGFTEKYGMEYRRAYYDEPIDTHLLERHRREIFPLLKNRRLFAEVEHFQLYPFMRDGIENDNVFAYSNEFQGTKSLAVYHNTYSEADGWIHRSVPANRMQRDGTRKLTTTTLGDALDITDAPDRYCLFFDTLSRKWFIRNSAEIAQKGLHFRLGAFQAHVFTHFHEVRDTEKEIFRKLAEHLGDGGVDDIKTALREMEWQPAVTTLNDLVRASATQETEPPASKETRELSFLESARISRLVAAFQAAFAEGIHRRCGSVFDWQKEFLLRWKAYERTVAALKECDETQAQGVPEAVAAGETAEHYPVAIRWMAVDSVKRFLESRADLEPAYVAFVLDALLQPAPESSPHRKTMNGGIQNAGALPGILTRVSPGKLADAWKSKNNIAFRELFELREGRRYLEVNEYKGITYFRKESFETLMRWFALARFVETEAARRLLKSAEICRQWKKNFAPFQEMIDLSISCGYSLERFLEGVTRR